MLLGLGSGATTSSIIGGLEAGDFVGPSVTTTAGVGEAVGLSVITSATVATGIAVGPFEGIAVGAAVSSTHQIRSRLPGKPEVDISSTEPVPKYT